MTGNDNHIGRPLLFDVGVVVVLTCSAAALAFISLPRLASHHMDRVSRSSTLLHVVKWYNATRLKRAGGKHSATAILTHVGRHSGRTYQTPLGAAGYGDGFVLSLAVGPDTDWCRNVMAAGRATLAWKGQTYTLGQPEIISGPRVLHAWPIWERVALRAAGIEDFVWLHHKNDEIEGVSC